MIDILLTDFFVCYFPHTSSSSSPSRHHPIQTTEDIAIYIAANSAANLVVSGPRVAAAAFRSSATASVVYGVGMKSAVAVGFNAYPAMAIATSLAAACGPSGATLALASRVPAAGKSVLAMRSFGKALPVGAFFAAEYAAFDQTKRRVAASGAFSVTVPGRFVLGATVGSITAFFVTCVASKTACASVMGDLMVRPAVAVARRATATSASKVMTRSKAVWYGTFEALKTAAHGPNWDAAAPAAAATGKTVSLTIALEEKQREASKRAAAAARASSHAAAKRVGRHGARTYRLPAKKVRRLGRRTLQHTPLKVMMGTVA